MQIKKTFKFIKFYTPNKVKPNYKDTIEFLFINYLNNQTSKYY